MTADRRLDHEAVLVVPYDQPLIVLPFEIDGREVEHYFADEDAARAAVSDAELQLALDAIGAWSDLDWDELEGALDRKRHETPPAAPITP